MVIKRGSQLHVCDTVPRALCSVKPSTFPIHVGATQDEDPRQIVYKSSINEIQRYNRVGIFTPFRPAGWPRESEQWNTHGGGIRLVSNPLPLAILTFSLCLGTFLLALVINITGVVVFKVTAVFDSLDDVAW